MKGTSGIFEELIEYSDKDRRVVVSSTIDDRFVVQSWNHRVRRKPNVYLKDTLDEAREVLINIILTDDERERIQEEGR